MVFFFEKSPVMNEPWIIGIAFVQKPGSCPLYNGCFKKLPRFSDDSDCNKSSHLSIIFFHFSAYAYVVVWVGGLEVWEITVYNIFYLNSKYVHNQ